jgi:hypothetical protein
MFGPYSPVSGLDPDPYSAWIRIQPIMLELDPDPDQMNADPQPCFIDE